MLSAEHKDRRSSAALAALLMAIFCFVAARTHADPDLWGHVRFGQDILARGIHTSDPYSYLSGDQPWINHELLAEIAFGAVYNGFGVPGLVGLKVAMILLMLGVVLWRLCRSGMHVLRAGIVVVVVLMLMSAGLWTLRPHLFTYVLFLVTLLLIDQGEKGNKAALWILPLVMLVWANSHGGFLAGLAITGIWALMHIVMRLLPARLQPVSRAPKPMVLLLLLGACVAATVANPYGFDLLAFLLRTATVPRPEISEWQPLPIASKEGAAYLAALAASILSLVYSRRPRAPALIAVLLATAVLPLQALRHLPLFGLSFAVLVGEHLADVWNRWSPDVPGRRRLPPVLALAGTVAFLAGAVPHFRCIRIDPSFIRFPARAVAVLKHAHVRGNVATFFDWGEYIVWHLSPGVRVSVDGRRETVYSPESYAQSLRFLYGVGDWDAILENPLTDMALVGRDQPTYNLMRLKSGWVLVYEDSVSALFARPESVQAEAIRKTVPADLPDDGAGLCFP
jgi:hypothetical protein